MASRRGAHTAAKKTGSMHFISDAFAPFLVSREGINVLNSTILHLTGSYDLTTIIRQRRLRWLGHVHRMEDGHLPKDIHYDEFYDAPRRTDRPKLRYKDVIERDMVRFHISLQSWEKFSADRKSWRASLSFGYSLSATSCAEKLKKRRAIVDNDGMGHDDDDYDDDDKSFTPHNVETTMQKSLWSGLPMDSTEQN